MLPQVNRIAKIVAGHSLSSLTGQTSLLRMKIQRSYTAGLSPIKDQQGATLVDF